MKFVVAFLFLVCFSVSFTQIRPQGKRTPCFQKSIDRMGQRFVDWECGKSDRILDCNEKLESNPGKSLVVHGQSGIPFSGTCETCHDNGIRERIVQFSEGKVHGVDTTFYASGCPQVIRNHIEGVENGTWVYYNDSSGLEAWRINYQDGERHGKSIFYSHYMVGTEKLTFKMGNAEKTLKYGIYERDTVRIEHYNQGRLHGKRIEYYPGSKIQKEVNYENGLLDGPSVYYGEKGQVLQELNFKQGKKDGKQKYYFDNGNLLRIESWQNGVKSGEFKTFYIQGYIQSIENYNESGQKHGWFEDRFPDEKLKRRARYVRDELVEEHVYDKYGNETRTVGSPESGAEDDALPKKKKKKKSKRWWQFWKK